MNDTNQSASTTTADEIRPVQDRVFLGLWALWAAFIVTPCLLAFVGCISALFFMKSDFLDLLGFAGIAAAVILGTGVIGYIGQFVVIGYGSPLRLRRQH